MRIVYLNGIRYRIQHAPPGNYIVYRSWRNAAGWVSRTYVYGQW